MTALLFLGLVAACIGLYARTVTLESRLRLQAAKARRWERDALRWADHAETQRQTAAAWEEYATQLEVESMADSGMHRDLARILNLPEIPFDQDAE